MRPIMESAPEISGRQRRLQPPPESREKVSRTSDTGVRHRLARVFFFIFFIFFLTPPRLGCETKLSRLRVRHPIAFRLQHCARLFLQFPSSSVTLKDIEEKNGVKGTATQTTLERGYREKEGENLLRGRRTSN